MIKNKGITVSKILLILQLYKQMHLISADVVACVIILGPVDDTTYIFCQNSIPLNF